MTTTAARLLKIAGGKVHEKELFHPDRSLQAPVQPAMDVPGHIIPVKGEGCLRKGGNGQAPGLFLGPGGCVLHQEPAEDDHQLVGHIHHQNHSQHREDGSKLNLLPEQDIIRQPADGLGGDLGQHRRQGHSQQDKDKVPFPAAVQQTIQLFCQAPEFCGLFHLRANFFL